MSSKAALAAYEKSVIDASIKVVSVQGEPG
jgi:hypothetical protein